MGQLETRDVLSGLRARKAYLGHRFGVVRLGLFGSVARNDADDQSDIDIFYESAAKETGLEDLLEMEAELEKTLGRKVDLVNLKYMNPLVRLTAQKDFVDA